MIDETFPPGMAEGGVDPAIEHAADDSSTFSCDSEDIEALCAEFAETLYNPHYGSLMLRRQAQLLDHLLYAVMKGKVIYQDGGIELALQIQKQCMDTVKAVSAIEYMRAIAPPPPPLKPGNEMKDT